jgi:hypothetical protein
MIKQEFTQNIEQKVEKNKIYVCSTATKIQSLAFID